VFVVEDATAGVVGFAAVGPARESDDDDAGAVSALYVDPVHLGKGFGRGLFADGAR